MSLTKKELESIKKIISSKKITTAKQLLAVLEEKYVLNAPIEEGLKNLRDINSCVSPTRSSHSPKDDLEKREAKEGFKIMTQGRSSKYEEHRKSR